MNHPGRFNESVLPLDADEALDLRIARIGHRDWFLAAPARATLVEQHGVRIEIVDAGECAAVANGPIDRGRCQAEHALDLIQQLEGVEGRLVQLVDEGQYWQPARPAHLEQLERLRLDPLGCVEHHHDAVDCEERPVGVFAEVLVAGRVEQRHVVPVELELERGSADGDAPLLLHFHPVGHRVALSPPSPYRPGELDGSGVEQKLLGQGRLAGVGVGDDGKRPASGNFARQNVRVTDRQVHRPQVCGRTRRRGHP